VDPFQPFIVYFIARGEWVPAIVLALVVVITLVITFVINARSRSSRAHFAIDARGEGNQTTVVSGVKADGDVTVSPRQRNG
jgi:uncharacterized protein (UPF0333 family)